MIYYILNVCNIEKVSNQSRDMGLNPGVQGTVYMGGWVPKYMGTSSKC